MQMFSPTVGQISGPSTNMRFGPGHMVERFGDGGRPIIVTMASGDGLAGTPVVTHRTARPFVTTTAGMPVGMRNVAHPGRHAMPSENMQMLSTNYSVGVPTPDSQPTTPGQVSASDEAEYDSKVRELAEKFLPIIGCDVEKNSGGKFVPTWTFPTIYCLCSCVQVPS